MVVSRIVCVVKRDPVNVSVVLCVMGTARVTKAVLVALSVNAKFRVTKMVEVARNVSVVPNFVANAVEVVRMVE